MEPEEHIKIEHLTIEELDRLQADGNFLHPSEEDIKLSKTNKRLVAFVTITIATLVFVAIIGAFYLMRK